MELSDYLPEGRMRTVLVDIDKLGPIRHRERRFLGLPTGDLRVSITSGVPMVHIEIGENRICDLGCGGDVSLIWYRADGDGDPPSVADLHTSGIRLAPTLETRVAALEESAEERKGLAKTLDHAVSGIRLDIKRIDESRRVCGERREATLRSILRDLARVTADLDALKDELGWDGDRD